MAKSVMGIDARARRSFVATDTVRAAIMLPLNHGTSGPTLNEIRKPPKGGRVLKHTPGDSSLFVTHKGQGRVEPSRSQVDPPSGWQQEPPVGQHLGEKIPMLSTSGASIIVGWQTDDHDQGGCGLR